MAGYTSQNVLIFIHFLFFDMYYSESIWGYYEPQFYIEQNRVLGFSDHSEALLVVLQFYEAGRNRKKLLD
jgi:hypothetical protein